MDRNTALVIITTIIAVIVMFYILLYYGIIGPTTTSPTSSPSPTTTPPTTTPPTTTPPTTTPPSSPFVAVYYYYNGTLNSINLPLYTGTTIQFTQGTDLTINGTAQPNQQVTLTIYAPNGQQVYTTSTTAGANGNFSMTVPSSNATPNALYKIVFSLGPSYYFYAIPVPQQSASYDTVTIFNPSNAPEVELYYYGQFPNQTATLQPGQAATLIILNNTTVNVYVYANCSIPRFPAYTKCYSFQVTQSGTITLNEQQLNLCVLATCG